MNIRKNMHIHATPTRRQHDANATALTSTNAHNGKTKQRTSGRETQHLPGEQYGGGGYITEQEEGAARARWQWR